MPKKDVISQERLKSLYGLAEKIKNLAPWKYMNEASFFGVEDPNTKELGFVSVLGANKEHYAITVYRGVSTLNRLLEIYEHPELQDPSFILELPQVQLSFENRDYLENEERAQIQKLGLKFRGKNAWPCFRMVRPSFLPWFMKSSEAELLYHAVEQAIPVLERFKKDQALLPQWSSRKFLIRKQVSENNKKTWVEEIREILPDDTPPAIVTLNFQQLHKLKKFKHSSLILELDYFLFPSVFRGEKKQAPFMTYIVIAVDHDSGTILGHLLNDPNEYPLEELTMTISNRVMALLEEMELLPKAFCVKSSVLLEGLKPLANALDIRLERRLELPKTQEVKEHFLNLDPLNSLDFEEEE